MTKELCIIIQVDQYYTAIAFKKSELRKKNIQFHYLTYFVLKHNLSQSVFIVFGFVMLIVYFALFLQNRFAAPGLPLATQNGHAVVDVAEPVRPQPEVEGLFNQRLCHYLVAAGVVAAAAAIIGSFYINKQ